MKRFCLILDHRYFIFKIRPEGTLYVYQFGGVERVRVSACRDLEEARQWYHGLRDRGANARDPEIMPKKFWEWRGRVLHNRRIVAESKARQDRERRAVLARKAFLDENAGGFSEVNIAYEDRERQLRSIYFE